MLLIKVLRDHYGPNLPEVNEQNHSITNDWYGNFLYKTMNTF